MFSKLGGVYTISCSKTLTEVGYPVKRLPHTPNTETFSDICVEWWPLTGTVHNLSAPDKISSSKWLSKRGHGGDVPGESVKSGLSKGLGFDPAMMAVLNVALEARNYPQGRSR